MADERLCNPISTAELQRRWTAVRSAMPEQKLDALIVHELAATMDELAISRAIQGYGSIIEILDGALGEQTSLDLVSFQNATGRLLDDEEHASYRIVSRKAQRAGFLVAVLGGDRPRDPRRRRVPSLPVQPQGPRLHRAAFRADRPRVRMAERPAGDPFLGLARTRLETA